MADPLPIESVRKVAALARLDLPAERAEQYRGQLAQILTYVERLRTLDLAGVEPMATPLDSAGPLAADEPGPTLPTSALAAMSPAMEGDFIRVPKVLGDGGAA